MRWTAIRAKRWAVMWLGMGAWLTACGSTNADSSTTGENQAGKSGEDIAPSCVAGAPCPCIGGAEGRITCDGSISLCNCSSDQCPALSTTPAPTVNGCGGMPLGTWRLTEAQPGRTQLSATSENQLLGTCDAMLSRVAEDLPVMLMTLHDGGVAEYQNPGLGLSVAFSQSCVTSKVPALTCGASGWSLFHDCELDCDVCTCAMYSATPDDQDQTWGRTDEALTLSLFGQPADFSYCLSGDTLELSTSGVYLVFERVHRVSQPAPCAERTPETCEFGEDFGCNFGGSCPGCRLGGCVGPDSCKTLSESACGTTADCTWQAMACWGDSQRQCRLEDFGKLPGCELTTQPVTCQGTPAACEDRQPIDCNQGCAYSTEGRCFGNTPCDTFFEGSCPGKGGCTSGPNDTCTGTSFSCAIAEYSDTCERYSNSAPGDTCVWQDEYCSGSPNACESLTEDECGTVPGCVLAP